MAELLNDKEITQLLGSVIENGDKDCVRPNSYVLRLGAVGEFHTTGKEFELGSGPNDKKGIIVSPGQSVALTAFETINFTRETVMQHFPDCDLHGIVSPTTDLQREGVVAPTTQVDAGYRGTLNWTLSNSSSEERRFVFGERLFRLSILKLAEGERPDTLYGGAYQNREGYVRSERKGAPTGMRAVDWEDSTTEEGPEALLDRLIQSGFPWNVLGTRFKVIGDQFRTVTNEYAEIRESIERLERDVEKTARAQDGLTDRIRELLREELPAVQDRILIRAGAGVAVLAGIGISLYSSQPAREALESYGIYIGLALVVVPTLVWLIRRRRSS
ncbi:MAG: hypothetical protein OXG47_07430 [bacterium]|nr:hypothetical protein [bacterium]